MLKDIRQEPPATPIRANTPRHYMSGIQALVELPMLQRERDVAAGLNTAGFISGYRGSPLGNLDQALWTVEEGGSAKATHRVPARRERGARARPRCGGRSRSTCSRAPVRRRVRPCGTARGRAPTAASTCSSTPTPPAARRTAACWRSSATTTAPSRPPCRTRATTSSAASMIPVLNPSGVQEFLDFGLHGWAMSRFSRLLGRR